MCDSGCIEFGERTIVDDDVRDRRVLEVGSRDVNGSLRPHVQALQPTEYIGVDIQSGLSVDKIVNADSLVRTFGEESFDVVISTEMLEHVKDWRLVVSQLKRVLKPDGILVITTRSKGTPYHDYPGDYWRFEMTDMRAIFGDMIIEYLEIDPTNTKDLPGVMMKARKPLAFQERNLSEYIVYSMEEERAIS